MELEKIVNKVTNQIPETISHYGLGGKPTEVEKLSKMLIDFAEAIKEEAKQEIIEYFKTYGIPPRY